MEGTGKRAKLARTVRLMGRRLSAGYDHACGIALVGAVVAAMATLVVWATPAAGQVAATGGFVIEKVFEGDAALRGAVTIAVSCSNGRSETIIYAPGGAPTDQVVGGLAPGTRCTVTEPADGSSAAVTVTTTGVPAVVVADESAMPTVRIVNTYTATPVPRASPPASIIINKVLTGDDHLRSDINVRVLCVAPPGVTGGTFDQTRTIAAGVTQVPPLIFAPIEAPADCTVTEPVTGANDAVDVTVTGETTVRVTPNDQLQLTLVDNYQAKTGSLRVRKVVDGAGAALRGNVVLAVSCTDGTTRTLVVPAGQTTAAQTVAPIVATSQCTVTETNSGEVAGVVDVAVTPPTPQTVTIAAGAESVVDVRDTYTGVPAVVQVAKEVAGPAAGSQGQVELQVVCSDGTASTFTVPPQTPAGRTQFAPLSVPVGSTCAVMETATGSTDAVDVATTIAPGAVFAVAGPMAVVVTDTYTAKPGRLVGDQGGRRGRRRPAGPRHDRRGV